MDRSLAGPTADRSPYRPPARSTATERAVESSEDATRYLCVAAYRDARFRKAVLAQIEESGHKAIAPLYGLDLKAIVAHCAAAHRRDRSRSAIVLVSAIGWMMLAAIVLNDGQDHSSAIVASFVYGAWLAAAALDFHMRYAILPSLTRTRFATTELPRLSTGLEALVDRRVRELEGNVVVYTGYNPFVGSGLPAESWSFAVDVTKPRRDFGVAKIPGPVDIAELNMHVADALTATQISGLRLRGEVYVNGMDVRTHTALLAEGDGPPSTTLDGAALTALMTAGDTCVRYYTHAFVRSWNGELMLSLFYRFSRVGQNLFSEASVMVLPPSKEEYRVVDSLPTRPTLRGVAAVLGGAIVSGPFVAIGAMMKALSAPTAALERAAKRRRERREMRENPCYDFGAGVSIRELGMSDQYLRYFQRIDREMYGKVLERQLLATVCSYLEARDIDTSELVERQSTILNTGVILAGTSIQGENVVLGKSIKAAFKSLRSARANSGTSGTQPAAGR